MKESNLIYFSFLFFILFSLLFIQSSSCQEYKFTTPLQQQCTKESIVNWDTITNYYYGVAGTGFIGKEEWIGLCESKYQWGGPWRPIDGYKHTLCGNLFIKKRKSIFNSKERNKNYHLISDGDGDMVFYITPDSTFRWLLFKSLRPQGHHFKDFSIGCEVAIKEPGNTIETDAATFIESMNADSLQYKPVGVYGPWVSDIHHEKSPEMHPVQQMWRVEEKQKNIFEYQLYSFLDNSSRFNNKEDFSDTCFLKPWVTTPQINVFYIPFVISLMDSRQLIYDLIMPSSNNINLYDKAENQLKLVFNGITRLTVNKSLTNFPSLEFFDLCQVDENTIHGYLKIETSIGKANVKSGAHAVLKVVKTQKD